mmetsp:Transcript_16865/g.50360  ORF Transcript_16865/g.50360 Transcript_16865/m.50360 type:complete len:251 (+) Transcript_16865:326-1078(+)
MLFLEFASAQREYRYRRFVSICSGRKDLAIMAFLCGSLGICVHKLSRLDAAPDPFGMLHVKALLGMHLMIFAAVLVRHHLWLRWRDFMLSALRLYTLALFPTMRQPLWEWSKSEVWRMPDIPGILRDAFLFQTLESTRVPLVIVSMRVHLQEFRAALLMEPPQGRTVSMLSLSLQRLTFKALPASWAASAIPLLMPGPLLVAAWTITAVVTISSNRILSSPWNLSTAEAHQAQLSNTWQGCRPLMLRMSL